MRAILGALTICCLPTLPAIAQRAPDAAHAGEPYVVEHLSNHYRFEADGTGLFVTEFVARVQNEAGVHQLGQFVRPYVAGRSRIEATIEVTRPDGSVLSSGAADIRDLPAPVTAAYPMYSDLRVLHATAPALAPRDMLRYRAVEHLERPEAPNHFWVEHSFNRLAIVLHEEVVVDVPAAVPVELDLAEDAEFTTATDTGRTRYTWTTSHTGRESPEKSAVPRPPAPDIALTSFSDWRSVADWYAGLIGDRTDPKPALVERARQIVGDATDDLQRIEAIYRFVSREFRYLGLSFGVHRYQPRRPAEVLANGYGDCKDKHTLLSALLRSLGYDARTVLIGALRKELVPEVPSPQQFDHVVTMVRLGDRTLWLDSTSQIAPFGYLPLPLRDKQALLVAPGGSEVLVTTPATVPFPIREEFRLEGEIDTAGTLKARVEHALRGDGEYALRFLFLQAPSGRWESMVTGFATALSLAGEVTDLDVDNPTEVDRPFTLRYTLTVDGFLEQLGEPERLHAFVPPFALVDTDDLEEGDDLTLGLRGSFENHMSIGLPAGSAARSPAPLSVDRDFAAYSATYEVEDDRLEAGRRLEVKVPELAADRFAEYEAFRRTVLADAEQAFDIRPSGDTSAIEGASVDRLEKAAAKAVKDKDHQRARELFGRVVEIEPKHESAWNDLGVVLVRLERYEEGLEALKKQLEANPYHEKVHRWMGYAHEMLGQLPEAEASYRNHLEQYPLDRYANAQLGRLLKDAAHCDEAIPFLQRATSIDQDDWTAWHQLGVCQLEAGDQSAATSTFEYIHGICKKVEQLYSAAEAALDGGLWVVGVALHERAGDLGHARSEAQLGWRYDGGKGVGQDHTAAMQWYTRAADRGHAYAQQHLGELYERGRGVERDYTEAAKWYRRAAEQGDAQAQLRLGYFCEKGRGIDQDHGAALGWYRKAAEQGDPRAEFSIGELYRKGRGVEQDAATAVEYYRMAAEQDLAMAQTTLGFMYIHGIGVDEDLAEARKWFQKAMDGGDESGAMMARVIDAGLMSANPDPAKMASVLKVWAEEGQAVAQAQLGQMYEYGKGVDRDAGRAAALFRAAADQGLADGQYNLGRLYLMGKGVEKDFALSYKWLLLAADDPDLGKSARELAEEVVEYLSPEKKAKAERQAREFVPTTPQAGP